MKTIYKYALPVQTRGFVLMPQGADVLTVQVQADLGPMVWAYVDDEANSVKHWFGVFGTGHVLPGPSLGRYLGTFQWHNGALVYHVFDRGEGEGGEIR